MQTLAFALIVKNEEQFLKKVICNIKPVADEIVIVDTGSNDGTVDIIKKSSAKFFTYAWDGDRGRARNFALSKVKSDWVFFIDADEFLDRKGYKKLRKIIKSPSRFIAYRILLRHYFDPKISLKKINSGNCNKNYMLQTMIRLFRTKKKIFFSRPVYPTLIESLRTRRDKVGMADIVVHHVDILRNNNKQKQDQYKSDVFLNLRKRPNDLDCLYVSGHYYFLKGNFKKASGYFKKVLDSDSRHVKAQLSLGLVFVMIGREREGMRLMRQSYHSGAFDWELESYLNSAYSNILARANGLRNIKQ